MAETTLSIFGFSRKQLGFGPRPLDYLEEVLREREQELLSEVQPLYDYDLQAKRLK